MRPTFLCLLLLPACAAITAPASPSSEPYRPRLHAELRGRAGGPSGFLLQDEDGRLLFRLWGEDGAWTETSVSLPFPQPGDLTRLDREHWLLSGYDPSRDRGYLLLIRPRAVPFGIEVLQRREYPHFDPWRLGCARRGRTLYLQDRLTSCFHAVPWPTPCRPLPDLAELSPPLGSAQLYDLELLHDYAMFATDAELIIYKDDVSSGRPFWQPRFSARWSAAAGWQVEWYFISDDPNARVIADGTAAPPARAGPTSGPG